MIATRMTVDEILTRHYAGEPDETLSLPDTEILLLAAQVHEDATWPQYDTRGGDPLPTSVSGVVEAFLATPRRITVQDARVLLTAALVREVETG